MYDDLLKILSNSNNIVFFGGAGVSTESGIPDFRSAMGLFNEKNEQNLSPEQIVSHSFFMSNTKEFYSFYKEKMIFKDALPNDAHIFLSKLEKSGQLKTVITQNIDGLHQKAGSKNVLELHGSTLRNYCMKCREKYYVDYILKSKEIPKCNKCGGTIRPDVVLYEESLNEKIISDSVNYISNADILIIGGTSLVVYPAAGLIRYFRGSKLILINKSSTNIDTIADIVISEPIGKVFGEVMKNYKF